jgi:hypothetical protein
MCTGLCGMRPYRWCLKHSAHAHALWCNSEEGRNSFTKAVITHEFGYGGATVHAPLVTACRSAVKYRFHPTSCLPSTAMADHAVCNFKCAHPDLDMTTMHPSIIYGPPRSGQVSNLPATDTNQYVYTLISGASGRPVLTHDRLCSAERWCAGTRPYAQRFHLQRTCRNSSSSPRTGLHGRRR